MIGWASRKTGRFLVTAVITAAATLALAISGSARTTTPPPDKVSCAGTGAGGCTFMVSRG